MTNFEQRRSELVADPYRPAYHFCAPYGWMNDPNGTVYWKGRWHLFYQYAPGAFDGTGGGARWGHAVSEDLIHWRDLPIALTPTPGTYDEKGCWSGTAMVEQDRVIANYHAHQGGNCIATASDDLLTNWVKHPANPVIPFDPEKTYDPCIWKEGDTYYSISGRITGATRGDGLDQQFGGKDIAYLYKSGDLEHWAYAGPLYEGGEFTNPGEDCACPDFFPIGDRHMLLFLSHNQGAQYYIGDYAHDRFTPQIHGRMNFTAPSIARLGTSGDVTAPITWAGPNGRRIMTAWLPEARNGEAMQRAGWAGILCLPRDLSLATDGHLAIKPAPELQALRGKHTHLTALNIGEQTHITGNTLEIHAIIDSGSATRIGLKVLMSPNGEEQTTITADLKAHTLTLDPSRASLSPDVVGLDAQVAPFELAPGELLDLTVFIDRSVVEVFANGRQCVTKRVYPTRPDSLGVQFFSDSGTIIRSLDAWEMASVW